MCDREEEFTRKREATVEFTVENLRKGLTQSVYVDRERKETQGYEENYLERIL